MLRVSALAALVALSPFAARADSKLADAIEGGRRDAALELIKGGADVNASQGDGTTPLHWATYKLDADLVGVLLAHGAKADVKNDYGASPLGEAVKAANSPLVVTLLKAGADANAANVDGETALMLASRAGLGRGREGADRARRGRERPRDLARADGADVGGGQRERRAREAPDPARRRCAHTRGGERLGRPDHVGAARSIPPDRRPHSASFRCALGLCGVRTRDHRGRRKHRSADAGRGDGTDGRARQLRVRHGERSARPRRESSLCGLVGGARRSISRSI